MLIRRKNPRVYCRTHQLRNIDFGGKKTSWRFLVTKCPESGKKGGKQSHWEAHYASFRRKALRHGEQRNWLLSNMQHSQETAYQRACARKYPHYYFIFV